jgi:RimJ/RimL family protein N-acetyltransferase
MIYTKLSKKDIPDIQKLAMKSWLFTYKKIYSKKSIKKQVADYYSSEKLQKELIKSNRQKECFIIAKSDGKIVGYAQAGRTKGIWELLRIYVSPELIGKGIGTELLKRIEKFIKTKKADRYVAYPHVRNPIAKRFYEKSGFKRNHKLDRDKISPCYVKRI